MVTSGSGSTGSPFPLPELPWLDDDDAEKRQNLDRLAGDVELAEDLRAQDFEGDDYDRFRDVLIRYGVAVIRRWLVDGRFVDKCRQKKIRGVPETAAVEFDYDDAESIAGEIVARALEPFREEALRGGRWDPRKGAAMKTYFITGCLMKAGPVLERWERTESAAGSELTEFGTESQDWSSGVASSADHDVIADEARRQALGPVKRLETRKAMVMLGMGFTARQVAEELGMTTKAVQKAVEYGQAQTRKAHGA